MAKRFFVFFSITILIAVAVAISWFDPGVNTNNKENSLSDADYFFNELTIKRFDKNGKLINQVNTQKLEHFENQQISKLKLPQITLKENDDKDWKIFAQTGIHQQINNVLAMQKSVIIEQVFKTKLPDENEIKISANSVNFNLSSNIISINSTQNKLSNDSPERILSSQGEE